MFNGLLPNTRLQIHRLTRTNPIFIIPGAATRHERLTRFSDTFFFSDNFFFSEVVGMG